MRVVLLVVLLAGCAGKADIYSAMFSHSESVRAMGKMKHCAKVVKDAPESVKDYIYTDCLIKLGATI